MVWALILSFLIPSCYAYDVSASSVDPFDSAGAYSSAVSSFSSSDNFNPDSYSIFSDSGVIDDDLPDDDSGLIDSIVDSISDLLSSDDSNVVDDVDPADQVSSDSSALDGISSALSVSNDNDIMLLSTLSSVYDGQISSTVITIFDRVVSKIPLTSHYVLCRSGQYEYTFAYGDVLILDGSEFVGSGVNLVTLSTRSTSGSGWSSDYLLSFSDSVDWSLDAGSTLVYSDLGSYPLLDRVDDVYFYSVLFVLLVFAFCVVIYRVFRFTLRKGTLLE